MSVDNNKDLLSIDTSSLTLTTTTSSGDNDTSMYNTPTSQGVNRHLSPGKRCALFIKFLFVKGFTNIKYKNLSADGKKRAHRLMTEDYSWSPGGENGKNRRPQTFEKAFLIFCEMCKGQDNDFFTPNLFDNTGSSQRVFFNKTAIDDYLVIRRQRGTICYMHSGALLQHYLECLRTPSKLDGNGKNHTMLDLSAYIRNNATEDQLLKYLEGTGGGSSIDFFSKITGVMELHKFSFSTPYLNSSLRQKVNEVTIEYILETFNGQKEPGLVSHFSVEEAFVGDTRKNFIFDYEVSQQSFIDYSKKFNKEGNGTSHVKHSMVLIGAFRDENKNNNKVWFLLQNFWENMYFCLVSDIYLASCNATVSFVPLNACVALANDVATVYGHYAETGMDEMEEHEPLAPLEG